MIMEKKIEELDARVKKLEWTNFIIIMIVGILLITYLMKKQNG
jgi:hypothetical protein